MASLKATLAGNFASIFQRPAEQFAPIDGLRALSVIMVVFFHAFYLNVYLVLPSATTLEDLLKSIPSWFNWAWHGEKGVDIFFVISGMLMTTILLRKHRRTGGVETGAFFIRRLSRIVPAYFSVVFVFLLMGYPGGSSAWANILFVNNVLPFGVQFLPWTWSIAVEMQFYLIFPFFLGRVLLRVKNPYILLGILLLAVTAYRFMVLFTAPELRGLTFQDLLFGDKALRHLWMDLVYLDLIARCGPLLCGIAVGFLFVRHEERGRVLVSKKPFWTCLVYGMAALSVVLPLSIPLAGHDGMMSGPAAEYGRLIWMAVEKNLFSAGIAFWILMMLVNQGPGRALNRLFSAWAWFPIARVSYSLYLIHIPLLSLSFELARQWTPFDSGWSLLPLTALICMGMGFLLAAVMFAVIEKPALDWAHGKKSTS